MKTTVTLFFLLITLNYVLGIGVSQIKSSLTKQQADSSCKGKCFSVNDPSASCQCNQACDQFNDCCDDFVTFCMTCQGRCGSNLDQDFGCQCNDACIQYTDCCEDYNDCQGGEGGASDGDLISISEELFAIAGLKPPDIQLDFQGKTDQGGQDEASKNLFTSVSESLLESGTYPKLLALMDNYDPDVTKAEDHTAQEQQEEQEFLDAVMSSPVMDVASRFLIEKKFVLNSNELREIIYELWFDLYDRDGTNNVVLGSSGFEHVFLGESKGNKVSGFHGWLHLYIEEKSGNLNYRGYIRETTEFPSNIYGATIVYDWNNEMKPIGGGFIGTPAELDLALSTICILARPDSLCHVSFNNHDFTIQTFRENVDGKIHVGSAYPIF